VQSVLFLFHQIKRKMKTTTIILAALLVLQVNFLFASGDNAPMANTNAAMTLAPVTPVEATFEEMTAVNVLMPITPAEATFDDMPVLMISTSDLSPETPGVAEFEDAGDVIDNGMLAPVTPNVADFE
jgi:hypothetical protein